MDYTAVTGHALWEGAEQSSGALPQSLFWNHTHRASMHAPVRCRAAWGQLIPVFGSTELTLQGVLRVYQATQALHWVWKATQPKAQDTERTPLG